MTRSTPAAAVRSSSPARWPAMAVRSSGLSLPRSTARSSWSPIRAIYFLGPLGELLIHCHCVGAGASEDFGGPGRSSSRSRPCRRGLVASAPPAGRDLVTGGGEPRRGTRVGPFGMTGRRDVLRLSTRPLAWRNPARLRACASINRGVSNSWVSETSLPRRSLDVGRSAPGNDSNRYPRSCLQGMAGVVEPLALIERYYDVCSRGDATGVAATVCAERRVIGSWRPTSASSPAPRCRAPRPLLARGGTASSLRRVWVVDHGIVDEDEEPSIEWSTSWDLIGGMGEWSFVARSGFVGRRARIAEIHFDHRQEPQDRALRPPVRCRGDPGRGSDCSARDIQTLRRPGGYRWLRRCSLQRRRGWSLTRAAVGSGALWSRTWPRSGRSRRRVSAPRGSRRRA